MRDPDRPGEERSSEDQSPEARVRRTAFLRPWGLLVLVIGGVAFALTLNWWIPPLTLATYAALVFLAVRDPLFRERVLGEERPRRKPAPRGLPPERRVLRLPRGETRDKVEQALEASRRATFAIEESDDATRDLLGDAVPKIHLATGRLVEVAEEREARKAGSHQAPGGPEGPEEELRSTDALISEALEELSTFRTRILRVSTESGDAARATAAELITDLDALNLRLEEF